MKAAYITLIKRSMVSTTVIMSVMVPTTATEAAVLRINAIIHEQVGYQPDPGCASQFGGTITGTGTSSLVGPVSLAANDCITPVGNDLSFEGKMIFTVLSGDEIFADYYGLFIPTNIPSIFTLKDSFFNITGGTGNFLGAKGGGKLYGSEDIWSGWGLIQVKGEISHFTKIKKGAESRLELLSFADANNPETNGVGGFGDLNSNTATLGDLYRNDDAATLVAINQVPESGSLALLGIGLASLAFIRRSGKVN